eukprot:9475286-Pyramimonas_sp.AAC.1
MGARRSVSEIQGGVILSDRIISSCVHRAPRPSFHAKGLGHPDDASRGHPRSWISRQTCEAPPQTQGGPRSLKG